MWLESQTAQRMRALYPPGGSPWFQTGHLPYIQAVTATLIARGTEVSALRLPSAQQMRDTSIRTAEIELAPSAWVPQFPASPIQMSLRWSDAYGWNYVVDDPANNGIAFGPGEDTTLRSRGLGPHVSLVAHPHHVSDAVAGLLAGDQFEPVGWTGRDPEVQDVTLEAALAAFRQHPGALALGGRYDQRLISRDVLLHLDPGLLADLAQPPDGIVAAEVDMRAAQVSVTATRYEVNPVPDGAISPRQAAQYQVFIEPADASNAQWTVLAGQTDVPVYLTATGQETTERQVYDLDTAMRTARQAAVQRREGIFDMTADQLVDAHPGRVTEATVAETGVTASMAAAAWSRPLRQSLVTHAARQSGITAARPTSASREQPEHGPHAER